MIPFIAYQSQLEEKIAEWRSQAGATMRVDDFTAYSGHRLYAITLSDFSVDAARKKALYVTQPHAHEPGTTAGMADLIEQLVTGRDLNGEPCRFDRERVLAETIVTLNPIGNPYGRENAPYPYYDGTQLTPEQFRCMIFGEDPENPGVQWKRVDLWDRREERHVPDPLGIVYEPIDEYRYVEPNRCQLSSYFKLFYKMDEVYRYNYWLDLHQMMFVDGRFRDTGYSCQIFLPLADIVPESRVAENAAWAADITDSWLKAGYAAKQPISTPYSGVQADYFRQNYTELHKRMHRISTEVINNRPHVPVDVQVKAQSLAIEATLLRLSGLAASH
ncbi:MAG: hypothetical protein K0Q59_879 [Paenibacillus sp.]|jgi:hypothetical protein|nr:hypothetical protein [Paenibacillus sp.]